MSDRLRCAILVAVFVSSIGCGHLRVPYFDKQLTRDVVCGAATEDCQPQQVPRYTLRAEADFAWPGNPAGVIGQKFSKKHILTPVGKCYSPVEDVHYKKASFEFDAELDQKAKQSIRSKLATNFDKRLQQALADQEAQAHVKAALEAAFDDALKTNAHVSFTLYSPLPAIYDAPGFQACLAQLNPDQYVITGIGVVEVEKQNFEAALNQKIATEVSATFVAEYSKMGLGGDATAEWSNLSNLAISQGFSGGWSYVYSLGYVNQIDYSERESCPDGKTPKESIEACADDHAFVDMCCGSKLSCGRNERASQHICVPCGKGSCSVPGSNMCTDIQQLDESCSGTRRLEIEKCLCGDLLECGPEEEAVNHKCRKCGTLNDPCCGGKECGDGLMCKDGTCKTVTLDTLRVTWNTGNENKDHDTTAVLKVFDNNGRNIGDISCCADMARNEYPFRWDRGARETRDFHPRSASKDSMSHGRFEASRIPVGNDDWDYSVTLDLGFSDGTTARYSCAGLNGCSQRW